MRLVARRGERKVRAQVLLEPEGLALEPEGLALESDLLALEPEGLALESDLPAVEPESLVWLVLGSVFVVESELLDPPEVSPLEAGAESLALPRLSFL